MSRSTYYLPLLGGIALVALVHGWVLEWFPTAWGDARWYGVAGVALGTALAAQLLLISFQGVLAQVLPVPGGRSIRGTGASVCGLLLLAACVCGVASRVMQSDGQDVLTWLANLAAVASGLGAMITYMWCWPTAARDFGGGEP